MKTTAPRVKESASFRFPRFPESIQFQAAQTSSTRFAAVSVLLIAVACVAVFAGCGGGSGSGSGGNSTPPNSAPSVAALAPNSTTAGGPAFTLTVSGSNFISSSTVEWNGSARPTTFASASSLQAAITAADIARVGTASVTVSTPAPGGGTSSALTFTIQPPPASITRISPGSAIAGGGPFTVSVTGANFFPSSVVNWNGSPRTTTFISSTVLQASVTAADIATVGAAKVTVANPGSVSAPSSLFVGNVGASNFAQFVSTQAAQDIVFDPIRNFFYLSVDDTAPTNPNTIAVLDPATGAIVSTVPLPAASKPHRLAISDDGQSLYAALDGSASIQRFTLPALKPDVSIPLGSDPLFGPYVALDLRIAPGAPHTVAVTLGNLGVSPSAQGGVVIYDDAIARPSKGSGFGGTGHVFDTLAWGVDPTTLFADNSETSPSSFYKLSIGSAGVTAVETFGNRFGGERRIHFDRNTGLVYSDSGRTLDSNAVPSGLFGAGQIFQFASPVMTPDFALGSAFFAGEFPGTGGSPNFGVRIQSYDLTHFSPIDSVQITDVSGIPLHLVRWEQNGLAFVTDAGFVVLLGGDFVGPAIGPNLTPPPAPSTPPSPAPNAPTIAMLTPSSAIAGAASLTINVSGTSFDPTAAVQFNGTALPTVFVSATQLTATISAANIAAPGTARITVANPSVDGGVSAPSPFFVGADGGTTGSGRSYAITVLNQQANDLIYDSLHQLIYLSIPGSVPNFGNTISVLDPESSSIVGQKFAGSEPNHLAISDDYQFLYASMDGSTSVQRFILPTLAADVHYGLGDDSFDGPFVALDLQVAPGASHTTAVSRGNLGFSPAGLGGVMIFDDSTARPTSAPGFGKSGGGLFDSLQWGPDATTLFAANLDDTGFDFYALAVTSSGVSVHTDVPNAGDGTHIHFDRGTNLVYTDGRRIIDPANPSNLVTFMNGGNAMTPDSALNLAFFVYNASGTLTLQTYNMTTHAPVDTITLANQSTGFPRKLIRWGQNGLAFITDDGKLYLVGGNFVH